jgi:tetratricopeptide (TPR) repeat protein/transcriptional regulator with XRE-family HTH domain
MTRQSSGDLAERARAARTLADLAQMLEELRQREARQRRGPALSYRQLAGDTGWSVAAIGTYLSGTRLPSAARLERLVAILGADAAERAALVAARDRLVATGRLVAALRVADRARGPAGAPRTLPASTPRFTGREAQLAILDRLLGSAEVGPAVLTGMAGVGKTALAVHWAHRVATEFPDGQLYVDLHGYDVAVSLSTMDALGLLLSSLGAARATLPDHEAGRAALYHRLLRGRRLLVLLDNANGADQVVPLLPAPPSVAVVTSRDDLRELVATDRVDLDLLTMAEAVSLLRALIGDRADREPEATRALALRCGRLPLALRVAAEHVASRPDMGLFEFVAEHDGAAAELDTFDAGDEHADVRAVFSWSLRGLPGASARTFRLLGLMPGYDLDVAGMAALAGVDPGDVGAIADTLARAHLIEPDGVGRLGMHDLVRAFAGESCERELSTMERHTAVRRLLDHYLATATAAIDRQFPLNRSTRLAGLSEPDASVFADVGAAAAWLAAERVNLVRACVHAARGGWPRHAIGLALVLRPLLDEGYYDDALIVHGAALAAAEKLGEECGPAERAGIYSGLGIAHWRLGRLDIAAEQLRLAFDEHQRAGNAGGATLSLCALGLVRDAQGRFREARRCQQRGLTLARAAGIRAQEGIQLVNLGYSHLRLEQYAEAAELYGQAFDWFSRDGEQFGLAQAQWGLAMALEGQGQLDEALARAEASLAGARSFGQVAGRVRVMATIGSILRRMGRLDEAVDQLAEALRECREVNNPRPTAQVLNALGETYHDRGDDDLALVRHTEAVALADQCGDRLEAQRALVGLGDAYAAMGDADRARESWRRAYRFYSNARLPAAARVRARLSS